jgi:ribosomal protein S18 acetylase RimI-like enzyme
MMQEAIDRARERGLERLELRVLRSNERAVRHYRSFEFIEQTNKVVSTGNV